MKKLLGYLRLIGFIGATAFYVGTGSVWVFLKRDKNAIYPFLKWWAHTCVFLLGIEVEETGSPGNTPALIVPNHRSYIDIVLFPLHRACSFVAKKEVENWPVIGAGARVVNCLFVERDSPDSRKRTRRQVVKALQENHSIVLFPEGTTYEGPGAGEFRPGIFHAVAGEDIPVLPVAIEYALKEDAWVGDDTFVPHFVKCFSKWKTKVKVAYGKPFSSEDGEELRSNSEKWVHQKLLKLDEQFSMVEP